MPSFRKANKQAEHAVQQKLSIGVDRHSHRHDQKVHSLGTARNYIQALTRITQWLQENKLDNLKNLSQTTALQYLELRSQHVGQKMLDQERQAIQLHLGIKLPVIKSEWQQVLKSRAYTDAQIQIIAKRQSVKYQLATQIAAIAGLRAHELLTLQKISERKASLHRQWSEKRFFGRKGDVYTVIGKGGLIREVLIPPTLAAQLEEKRLNTPMLVKDRSIHYFQQYDIGGGKRWSNSFSAASKRLLGWSHGAHGLRHSYAQQRMNELQQNGLAYENALSIVSQELGHFRPDITEVYLR